MHRFWLKVLASVATLVLISIAVSHSQLSQLVNGEWARTLVHNRGALGLLSLMGLCTAFTALGGPRQIVAFAMGYVLGGLYGTAFALLTMMTGCVLAYGVAALLLPNAIARKMPQRARKIHHWMNAHPFKNTLMVRLLPVGSNLATNMIAGALRIRFRAFFIASAIGYVPQAVVFTMAGAGVGFSDGEQLAISACLLLVTAVIGVSAYRNRDASSDLLIEEAP